MLLWLLSNDTQTHHTQHWPKTHTNTQTHTKPLGNTVSYSVNEQEAGSRKAQHAYTQEKSVCARTRICVYSPGTMPVSEGVE